MIKITPNYIVMKNFERIIFIITFAELTKTP